MEIIKMYLDNMFSALPKTEEIIRIKEDLLATMEDKYNELKWEGKSENEAIGIVISEFGNIDELTAELGVLPGRESVASVEAAPMATTEKTACRILRDEEVDCYLADSKRNYRRIGIGVFLCLLGIGALLLFAGSYVGAGLAVMLLFIACAAGFFIYGALSIEKYEYMKKEELVLEDSTRERIQREKEAFQPKFAVSILVGVLLCILAVIPVLVLEGSMNFLVGEELVLRRIAVMMPLIGIAAFLFINVGTRKECYDILLQSGEFSAKQKLAVRKGEPLMEAVAGIYWCVAVAIYLLWSFTSNNWGTTWLIWPVAAVLFGAVAIAVNFAAGKK